ncbi:hypothetical protein [Desulfuromonas sp. AOP6]|nr:hypothetical protein [Desulfuromonas sp. AOP6]
MAVSPNGFTPPPMSAAALEAALRPADDTPPWLSAASAQEGANEGDGV